MLESIPVPFQALLWPLLGAAVVGVLGRLLPDWTRRFLATVAAGLSLLALWSLRGRAVDRVEIFWEPLGFFRASPSLYPDELSLVGGILLCGLAAALLFGIRGRRGGRAAWHALILLSLAGALAVIMASNLLTLALGSALLDLALVGLALWAGEDGERGWGTSLSLVVPGITSTLLLVANALHQDVSAGTTSLLARELPAMTVTLLGVAALLRMSLFPLHPRGLSQPKSAAGLLLPAGAGIYLLGRVQTLAPQPWSPPWSLPVGTLALVAGGLLVWSGALAASRQEGAPNLAAFWTGVLVHQMGVALLFWSLLGAAAPWPLVSLPYALGALAIWWHAAAEHEDDLPPSRLRQVWQELEPRRAELRDRALARFPVLGRWPGRRILAWLAPLVPVVILVSLASAPLTAGARVRWPIYAALLKRGSGALLLLLVADTLLVAGLGTAFRAGLVRAQGHRHRGAALLAAVVLAFSLVVLALAAGDLGLNAVGVAGVSVWGLGLTFVLPWLLGAWLAGLRPRFQDYGVMVQSFLELGWLYRGLDWIGQRLVDLFGWLGQVGEGDGWWGWALIILALGAIFLGSR